MSMDTVNQIPVCNSPIAYALASLNPNMGVLNGMEVALEFNDGLVESSRKSILGVTDVSCFTRFSVKGPQANAWLNSQNIQTPKEINSWIEYEDSLILRMGSSEFLIEDQYKSQVCKKLISFNQATTTGVYKVQRADAAFILSGSEVLKMLSELCMLDLRDNALGSKKVVLTQIAGISATLLRQSLNGEQVYRVWCDGTFGAYMWNMLLEVARELEGGAVGLSTHYK